MATAVPHGAAIYLGIVQFFFATNWVLYVVYLPQLAAEAGISKEWVPWILVVDQVVFAVMGHRRLGASRARGSRAFWRSVHISGSRAGYRLGGLRASDRRYAHRG